MEVTQISKWLEETLKSKDLNIIREKIERNGFRFIYKGNAKTARTKS